MMKIVRHIFYPIVVIFFNVMVSIAYADVSRVWVQFEPQGADKALNALTKVGAEIHYKFDDLNAFAASVPNNALQGLLKNPNITYIEEDAKRFPSAQNIPYGIDAVQARDVWDSNKDSVIDVGAPTGSGQKICVIDSGLKTNHEDFVGVNITGGYPSGWNSDTCGHGTHVTGTIVAANNTLGVVGVSPGAASLFIVKVFDGADCGWTYSSDLVNAAQQCEAANANVINMSLGGSIRSRTEQRAFAGFEERGILSIAAAGNEGNKTRNYPASYSSVISVAAVDSNNVVADFSQQNSSVELAAPGVGVMSTVPWFADNKVTVDSVTYEGGQIENAIEGNANGNLVDGGLCDTMGSWSGNIVLCERGEIAFYDKVVNVQNSGGVAVIIFNNVEGGFSGTLGEGNVSTIPAISLSQADGQALQTKTGFSGSLTSSFEANKDGYEAWDGTSMATPHVSGVAVLVWSSNPSSSNLEIRNVLTNSALDLGDAGKDNAYGYGLVQAYNAWQLLGGGGGSANQSPSANFVYNCVDLTCSFDGSGSHDSDGTVVSYHWNFGDGNTASGVTASHTYASQGNYSVTLTVMDNNGADNSSVQPVNVSSSSSSGDTTPPVISNVNSVVDKGTRFTITWTTDEPADSVVTFTCCGDFSANAFVTSHSISLRGSKGVLYEYTVSSTDVAGNTATSGPHYHQN